MNITVKPVMYPLSVNVPSHYLKVAAGAPISHQHTMSDITDLVTTGNVNFIQETTPINAGSGDLWFKDSTRELKIYNGSDFQTQNINEGYF